MAELKTQRTKASVTEFLNGIENPDRKREAKAVAALMKKITGEKPAMWGDAIVGYGDMTYQYSNGKSAVWFPVGFSPRKANLTVYLMGAVKKEAALLKKLGPHKVGGGCLYLTKFDQIDQAVLAELIERTYREKRDK